MKQWLLTPSSYLRMASVNSAADQTILSAKTSKTFWHHLKWSHNLQDQLKGNEKFNEL